MPTFTLKTISTRTFAIIAIGLVVFASSLLSSAASAQGVLVWQATPGSARVVVPQLPGETSQQAVQKYFESMQTNADMSKLFKNYVVPDLSKSR
ncbi:MAG: hypothetical protein V4760_00655, partial [Bdellovibrionota bacterium]